jgi:hypothetical protein
MSKSYAIRVPLVLLLPNLDSQRQGKLDFGFDLLGILPPEEMKSLLQNALAKRNWIPDQKGCTLQTGKIRLHIDLENRQLEVSVLSNPDEAVTVHIKDNSDLARHLELAVNSKNPEDVAKIKAFELTHAIQAAEGLQAGEKEALLKSGIQARLELNRILSDVYREAITQKASTLGTISSTNESSDGTTLRIRVEINV